MSDEANKPPEREELEQRVIALLFGELGSEAAAEVEKRLEADAELRAFRDQMKVTLGLVKEASHTPDLEKEPVPQQLSNDRREALLAKFKVVPMPRQEPKGTSWIAVAAAAAIVVIFAGLILPATSSSKVKASRVASERMQMMAEKAEGQAADVTFEVAGGEPMDPGESDSESSFPNGTTGRSGHPKNTDLAINSMNRIGTRVQLTADDKTEIVLPALQVPSEEETVAQIHAGTLLAKNTEYGGDRQSIELLAAAADKNLGALKKSEAARDSESTVERRPSFGAAVYFDPQQVKSESAGKQVADMSELKRLGAGVKTSAGVGSFDAYVVPPTEPVPLFGMSGPAAPSPQAPTGATAAAKKRLVKGMAGGIGGGGNAAPIVVGQSLGFAYAAKDSSEPAESDQRDQNGLRQLSEAMAAPRSAGGLPAAEAANGRGDGLERMRRKQVSEKALKEIRAIREARLSDEMTLSPQSEPEQVRLQIAKPPAGLAGENQTRAVVDQLEAAGQIRRRVASADDFGDSVAVRFATPADKGTVKVVSGRKANEFTVAAPGIQDTKYQRFDFEAIQNPKSAEAETAKSGSMAGRFGNQSGEGQSVVDGPFGRLNGNAAYAFTQSEAKADVSGKQAVDELLFTKMPADTGLQYNSPAERQSGRQTDPNEAAGEQVHWVFSGGNGAKRIVNTTSQDRELGDLTADEKPQKATAANRSRNISFPSLKSELMPTSTLASARRGKLAKSLESSADRDAAKEVTRRQLLPANPTRPALQNAREPLIESPVGGATEALSKRKSSVLASKPADGSDYVTPGAPVPVKREQPKSLTPKPEVATRENAFSTFSLNVSDVAFKLAKAGLAAGRLPDAETVRSEEFLNAFNYHDPAPVGNQRVSFAWNRARNPFAHNRDLLRFSIQTAARGRAADQPLNLVVLLDASGSMERADRERIVAEMLTVLVKQLQATDKISVVSFARTPRLLIDGMRGGQPDQVLSRVTAQTPEGGTNIEAALDTAYEIARRHYLANGNNRVILLTDGAANLGDVNPETLRERVAAERKQGVALDCFGVGWEGYNDDLLESLSRNGDGRYGFINDPAEARSGFANLLAGALQVAAADVKAQVEFNPGRVLSWRQIGYDKHQLTKEQFRDNTVDAAEIGAAESGTALYSIAVKRDGVGPLGIARVRFRVPATGEYIEEQWELEYTPADLPLASASPALRLAAAATGFAEWLTANPFAGSVTLRDLEQVLSGVPEAFANDARPRELATMIAQARRVVGE